MYNIRSSSVHVSREASTSCERGVVIFARGGVYALRGAASTLRSASGRAATTVRSAPGVVYTSCERRRSCNLRDASLKRRGVFGLRPASRVCVLRLCSKSEEPHVSCECNEVFYVLRATRHLRLRSAFGAGSASCILRLAFCA